MTSNNELRKLAAYATQGVEHWDTEKPASEQWKSDHVANAAYMRKANPTKIISLLDQIEMLNKKLEVAREAFESIISRGDRNILFMRNVALDALKQIDEEMK